MRFVKGLLAVAMFGLLAVGSARADSIITPHIQVTGPVAGVYTHEYEVDFFGLNTLSAVGAHPDLFAVLDIHGLTGATFLPTAFAGPVGDWLVAFPWQTTVWNFGTPQISGGDSALLKNVQVTKVAGNDIVNGNGLPKILGTLLIYSTIEDIVPGICVGGYTQTATGFELTNADPTAVPIPVPAAVWTGLGLFGLLAFRKATR